MQLKTADFDSVLQKIKAELNIIGFKSVTLKESVGCLNTWNGTKKKST